MKNLFLVFALLLTTVVAFGQNEPPAIFYSNLTSGPNTGGQNNAGAFVSIHGKGFGTAQGSSIVTIGAVAAASYQSWSDTSITFQLGSSAMSGSIVVNVGGVASNSVPFTISAGNIYFVSMTGSDTSAGSYSAPWHTVIQASNAMQPGDIVYVENYVTTSVEANNTALILSRGGTPTAPMAMIAYPNSTVMIGSTTAPATGLGITAGNWILSGLTLRGAETAVSIGNVSGVRLTDNDVSCPNAYGVGSCIAANGGSYFTFLGNNIHDNGSTTNPDLENYHAMYLVGTNSVEIGWNQIGNTRGCRAINVRSATGMQHSFSVHGNYIHDTRCEAIAFGMVDPSLGPVNIYNNIVTNSGTGPAASGTPSGYAFAAISVNGGSTTAVQVYNNTIYNAGAFGGSCAGAIRAFGQVEAFNNIFYVLSGQQYVSADTNLSWINGTNNLFFGAGNPLGVFSNSVVGDPKFVALYSGNFHLQSGSPAIDAGETIGLPTDYDGVLRPQGLGYDIGAYEFPTQASTTGTLSTTPASLSFGSTTVGQSATTTAILSNTGTTSVTISQVNSNNVSFQASGITFPLTLNAGQSATLTATFAPTSSGAQSAAIAVASNASNSPTSIAVTGTGMAAGAPAISLSPASLTFASQAVATKSSAQAVTLTNTGAAALSIGGIAASGDYAQTNNCASSLAANASCTISVTFTPTVSGTRTGAITFTDNAASSPQQVSLSGTATGTGAATLQASASSLAFGSVAIGAIGNQTVVITNTGSATATISWISTADVVYTETGIALQQKIAAGASVTVTVAFAPTSAGALYGTLAFQSNATNPVLNILLNGTGVTSATPAVSLSPTALTFTSQAIATQSPAQAVTLTNSGTAALTISGIAASGDFAQTNNCASSLAAKASCTISVTFKPTASGTRTGAITFTDNAASSPQQVSLSGTATTAPAATLQASASSLSFGSVTVSANSTQNLVITNTGNASATISQIGTGNAAFTVGGVNLPATIAAGGTLTLSVTFTPSAAASFTGTLAVQSNASNPTLSVGLTGTGTTQAVSHSVALSWTDGSGSISGYNIYRSTQSGTGYAKLDSTLVASQSYSDTSVSAGQTYYYVVTAVDGSGNESAYSAQVSAIVPGS